MKCTSLLRGLVAILFLCGVAFPICAQVKTPSRKAVKEYRKALEAYRFLAPDIAIGHLESAIQRSPEFAEALFLKAQIYQEMDHPNREEALALALQVDATMFPHGWVTLAEIQWELGKYDEGLQSLDKLEHIYAGQLSEEAERRRAVRL